MLPSGLKGRRPVTASLVAMFVAMTVGCATTHKPSEQADALPVANPQIIQASGESAAADNGESELGSEGLQPTNPRRFGRLSPNSPCWYGNYLGPGNCGYDVLPIDALDAAAREHDLAYDKYGAAGPKGALFCLDVGKADLKLAKDAFKAWPDEPFRGKVVSFATALTFGPLGLTKVAALGVVTLVHRVEDRIDGKPRNETIGVAHTLEAPTNRE